MKNLFIIILSCILTTLTAQNNYFVSNTGNDSNNGLTPISAFQTLQKAADIVNAGDVVNVSNGIYSGFDIRNKSGTNNSPISFLASGNNVVLNASGPIRNDIINIENANYIIIDGFTARDALGNGDGIRVVLSDNCIIRNNICDNNAERGIFTAFTNDILIENNMCTNSLDEHGIYVSNSSDRSIIRFNECFGNNRSGIQINADGSAGGDGISSNPEIYGNILYDNNGGAGINLDGVVNALIYNNVIYNNHFSQGISLFQQDGSVVSSGAKIYNNTIIVPADGRWGILATNGANVNTEIINNIIINQHVWRGCISLESTTGFFSNHNILNDKMSISGDGPDAVINLQTWQNNGFDNLSLLADPLVSIFSNPNSNNYSLRSNSQAIDAGSNTVNSIVQNDIEGNLRPFGANYDIGAFEYKTVNCISEEAPLLIVESDVYLKGSCFGIILTSANGSCFRVIVSNSGSLQTSATACPD